MRLRPTTTRLATASVAACALAAGAALAGCASANAAGPTIKIASAYVIQPAKPGVINGYLVIQNSGRADRLLSVRSSAGGVVALEGPAGPASSVIRTVSALSIPGHSMVRLDPAGIHLMITGSGPIRQGTEITLTLTFAHAGTFQVAAQVTNPQTGGNTYFEP